jgi:hypothetical protein
MRRFLCNVGPLAMVLFLAVSAVILVPTSVEAQELEDVVYLKDGSVLRGTIVEQVPNESILIRHLGSHRSDDQGARSCGRPPARRTH